MSRWLDTNWPISFLKDEVEVHKNAINKNKTKNEDNIQPGFIIGFIIWAKDYTKEFRFFGNKAGNPEGAR